MVSHAGGPPRRPHSELLNDRGGEPEAYAGIVRRRRMVRQYADEPIEPETVDALLAYALRAPSAGFTQAVSWLVLTGESVRRFWTVTSTAPNRWLAGMADAPVLLVGWTDADAYRRRYAEPDKAWSTDDQPWAAPYWWVDAGMAAQSILLGATAHGLGACFFGLPTNRIAAVRAEFGVPGDQLSVGVISLGRPAADERPIGSPRRRRRRSPDELIHRESW